MAEDVLEAEELGGALVGGGVGGFDGTSAVFGLAGFGFGGGADVVDGASGVVGCVFGVGGDGGAVSPGLITGSAAVSPESAVKKVGGSSPSSRGLTLK